jgi:AraC-like DNA-binding protein
MKSLAVRLPTMTLEETAAVASATTSLIASCFRPSGRKSVVGEVTEPVANRVRHYIANNLHQPLTVAEICKHFGLSRSLLYRMFARHGGVASFVRNQKLSRAFTMLMSPNHRHRRVAEIGFDAGYQNDATFSRAFRDAFGVSPSDVRAVTGSMEDRAMPSDLDMAYRTWLTHLRRV